MAKVERVIYYVLFRILFGVIDGDGTGYFKNKTKINLYFCTKIILFRTKFIPTFSDERCVQHCSDGRK